MKALILPACLVLVVLSASGARPERLPLAVGSAGRVAVPAIPHAEVLTASPIPALPIVLPPPHGPRVKALATEYGIPLGMLARMIAYESGWGQNTVVRNPNGTKDYGLMQLNGAYLADFAWRYNGGKSFDPLDPEKNLVIGVRHLATLYRVTGEWRAAVAAYNCGLTRYLSGKVPAATGRYIEAVFRNEEDSQ